MNRIPNGSKKAINYAKLSIEINTRK